MIDQILECLERKRTRATYSALGEVIGSFRTRTPSGRSSQFGTVKLTDLRTCSAPWTLPKLLILSSSADRFRPQNPRILLNLTVPRRRVAFRKSGSATTREPTLTPVRTGSN